MGDVVNLSNDDLEKARVNLPPGYRISRTFTHQFGEGENILNIRVDELIRELPEEGKQEIIWACNPFEMSVIGGMASPFFRKEYVLGHQDAAYRAVKSSFEEYWSRPVKPSEITSRVEEMRKIGKAE